MGVAKRGRAPTIDELRRLAALREAIAREAAGELIRRLSLERDARRVDERAARRANLQRLLEQDQGPQQRLTE
jgi:hypothetical protein